MRLQRLLIANRGEIVQRIARTARRWSSRDMASKLLGRVCLHQQVQR